MSDWEAKRKAALGYGLQKNRAKDLLDQSRASIVNAPPPASRQGVAVPADPNATRNVIWVNPETGEEEAKTLPADVALAALQRGRVLDASEGENARLFDALSRRNQMRVEDTAEQYTFAEGVGESVLGGITGGVDRLAWSEQERALFAKWVDDNPWAAGLGEAFGFLAPLMFTGGLSAGAQVTARGSAAALSRAAMSTSSLKQLARMTSQWGTAAGLSERAAAKIGAAYGLSGTRTQAVEGIISALPAAFLAEMNEEDADMARFGANLALYGGLGAFVPVAVAGVRAARGEAVTGAEQILKNNAGDATLDAAQARVDQVAPSPERMTSHRDALLELVEAGDEQGIVAYLQRVAANEGPNDARAAQVLLRAAKDRLTGGPRAWFDKSLDDIRNGAATESIRLVDDLSENVIKPLIEGAAAARGFGRGTTGSGSVGPASMAGDPSTRLGQTIQLNRPQLQEGYSNYAFQRVEDLVARLDAPVMGESRSQVLSELRELVGDNLYDTSGKLIKRGENVRTTGGDRTIDLPRLYRTAREIAEDAFELGATGKTPRQKRFRLVDDEIDYGGVAFQAGTKEGKVKIPLKSARGKKAPLVATYITGDFADPSLGGSWRVTLPRAARKIVADETGEEVTQVIIRGRGRDAVGSIPSGAPRQLPTEEAIREAFEGIPLRSVVAGDVRVPPLKGGKIALEAEELGDKSMTKNAASAVYQTVEKWSREVPLGKTAPTDTRLPKGSFDLSREAQAQVDALRDSVEIFGKAFQQDAAQARKVYRDLIESLGSAPHRDIKDYISQKGDVALNEAVGDFLYGKRNTPPAADKLLRWIWDVANQTAQLNAIRGTSGPGHGMEYVKSAFQVLSKRQAQLETLEAANRLSFKARRETTEETWGAAVGRAFMGLPGAAMQSIMPWQARAFLNAGPLRALQSLVGDAAFQQARKFTEGAGAKTRLKVATNLADQKMRAYSSTEVATSNPTSPTYLSVSEVRSRLPVPATVMGIRTAGRRLWDSWDEDPDFSQRYAELSEAVTEVGGSPQGMLLGLSVLTEPLHEADPTGEMGGMYGDSTAQAFSYLAEVMPTGARDPLSGALVAPGPSECREWLSAADALCDPAAAMGEMVATGLVRQSAVEAVRTCYPELFAQLSMAYAEGAAEAGADYPYAKRMTLWHATGLEIDQTMTDSFLLTASSEFSQTSEQSAALGQPAAMQAQGFAQAAARMPVQKTMQSVDNMTGLQSLEQKGIG